LRVNKKNSNLAKTILIYMFEDNLFDKAFNLFSRVQQQDFEYVYRGYFTHNITKKILTLADLNIQKAVAFSTIQKRIYYIMVEGIQNISRHQDEIDQGNDEYPGIFAIQKQKARYYVTTGNLVLNNRIPSLKDKIKKINSLEKEDLKKFHKEILRSGALSLLSIIKGRLNISITTIRLSNVMVEMIQNIIKHGAKEEQDSGAPGIFFIQQKENADFMLTSGNYVHENEAKDLEEKLKYINNLSKSELEEYYDKILLDLDSVTSKKSGLGFPDLRIKSGQKLNHYFHKLKENLYFYILQTTVINKKS